MKQLVVVRHAKSSWKSDVRDDFDRPLNDRGHHDAPLMARRLQSKFPEINAFVSSTANRALTTAHYFAEVYNVDKQQVMEVPALYHAAPDVFFDVISGFNDALHNVAVFSHNPGITEFVNQLTTVRIDDMPTCAMFAIQVKTESWQNFQTAEKSFLYFDYPKNI